MSLFDTFTAASRRDYPVLIEAALVSIAVRVALLLLPFSTVQRLAARKAGAGRRRDRIERESIVGAVHSVTRYLQSERRCLLRALAVQWMLHRAGQSAELRIGVTRSADGVLLAHAWTEQDGDVITGGKDAPRIYRTFKSFDTASWQA